MHSISRIAVATVMSILAATSIAGAAWNSSLSGRVVDVRTMQPVAAAHIKVYAMDSYQLLGDATTDANGSFTVTGLRGGQYRVAFYKAGYQHTMVTGILVRPGERLIEAAPIAMYAVGEKLPSLAMAKPCGALVQPGQTGDEYVICAY